MALQNFEPAPPVNPPASAGAEATQQGHHELRAMALGIQAWFDDSAEPLFQEALRPQQRSKRKPTRPKSEQ